MAQEIVSLLYKVMDSVGAAFLLLAVFFLFCACRTVWFSRESKRKCGNGCGLVAGHYGAHQR